MDRERERVGGRGGGGGVGGGEHEKSWHEKGRVEKTDSI